MTDGTTYDVIVIGGGIAGLVGGPRSRRRRAARCSFSRPVTASAAARGIARFPGRSRRSRSAEPGSSSGFSRRIAAEIARYGLSVAQSPTGKSFRIGRRRTAPDDRVPSTARGGPRLRARAVRDHRGCSPPRVREAAGHAAARRPRRPVRGVPRSPRSGAGDPRVPLVVGRLLLRLPSGRGLGAARALLRGRVRQQRLGVVRGDHQQVRQGHREPGRRARRGRRRRDPPVVAGEARRAGSDGGHGHDPGR